MRVSVNPDFFLLTPTFISVNHDFYAAKSDFFCFVWFIGIPYRLVIEGSNSIRVCHRVSYEFHRNWMWCFSIVFTFRFHFGASTSSQAHFSFGAPYGIFPF